MRPRLRGPLLALALVAGLVAAPLQGAATTEDTSRVYVVVIDGLDPADVTPVLTPNLAGLISAGQARQYTSAHAAMVTETNANHVAMVTGAWGETTGVFANGFLDVTADPPDDRDLESPSLLLSETIFDAVRRQDPDLRTGAVMGKSKLRNLFGPTLDPSGQPGPSTDNPEGIAVTHGGPDELWGAADSPDPQRLADGRDLPSEPGTGSGYSHDTQTMSSALKMIEDHDPHFMFVNLSNVDGFQHLHGARGPSGRAAVLNADLQVGLLIETLRRSGRWENTVLIVTADHSFQGTGQPAGTSMLPGVPERRDVDLANPVSPHLTGTVIILPDLIGMCPSTEIASVSHGGSASVHITDPGFDPYTSSTLTEAQTSCLDTVRERALAHRGVTGAYHRIPAEGRPSLGDTGWNLQTPRAGELVITAADDHSFLLTRASDAAVPAGVHGGPTAREIPFLIASGSPSLEPGTDAGTPAAPVDVAATIAWLLDVQPPADSVGTARTEAFSSRL